MGRELGDIGSRLRSERERHGISQRELARRVGLSASLISQIEAGQSRPSVSTLYAIVTELGASVDRLFGGHAGPGAPDGPEVPDGAGPAGAERPPSVVRPDERDAILLDSGVRWERLTTEDGGVDFLHVVYEVGGSSSQNAMLMRHPGREYGYVLSGRLGVQLGFDRAELGPGDSIAFDSTLPHRLWNVGDEAVHGIWFVVGRGGGESPGA